MLRLLPVMLLFSLYTYSQNKPDVGKVVADAKFNCSNYTFIDPLYGSRSFLDTLYNIKNICETPNQIEVRFTASYAPTPFFDIIILSYSNNQWSARKFEFNTDTVFYDSTENANRKKVIVSKLKTDQRFDSLMKELIRNDIFALPNLDDVKNKPRGPVCGLLLSLTFKVEENFRTYKFENTDFYITNSNRPIFRKYNNIYQILTNRLQKE